MAFIQFSKTKQSLNNIILFEELYDKASQKYFDLYEDVFDDSCPDFRETTQKYIKEMITHSEIDTTVPLYYLELVNNKKSQLCLCESELIALEASYKKDSLDYKVKKVLFLDLINDDELFHIFGHRVAEITRYSREEIQKIDEGCELVWCFDEQEHYHIIKCDSKFILPQNIKKNLPFILKNSLIVLIDSFGRYGVVDTNEGNEYKVILEFIYDYIRLDGFGFAEVIRASMCELIELETNQVLAHNLLEGSLQRDGFITINQDNSLQFHTKNKKVSKKYKQIVNDESHYKAVQDIQTNLWGFIDKDSIERIKPQFENSGVFRDGFCILQENNQTIVIDESANVVFTSPYEKIQHYKDDMFFVKQNTQWGVLKNWKFFVAPQKIEENLKEELQKAIKIAKKEFHAKRYELPLYEYIQLFDTFKSREDLEDAGLFGHKVQIDDASFGYIGWHYPSSASLYDMKIELPIDGIGYKFDKINLKKD